jgi:hypothetical protein
VAKKKSTVSKTVASAGGKKSVSTASKPRAKSSSTSAKTASAASPIAADAIGECAGAVWCCLNDNGPIPVAKLKKSVDAQVTIALG